VSEARRADLPQPARVTRRRIVQNQEMMDPARDLGDLRAALAVTLRLVQRTPGPAGLTVLNVPSDRELIDEVGRIRQLLDRLDAGEQSAD
jgi:hypothetical protein